MLGSDSPALRVRGGVGGTTVRLASLDRAAATLLHGVGEVAAVLARVTAVSSHPALVATSVLSPVTGVRVQAVLAALVAPVGLPAAAAGLAGLAAAVRAATGAYRAAEACVSASLEVAQDAVMGAVGAQWPGVAVAAARVQAAGVDQGAALDRAVFVAPWVADLAGGVEGLVLGMALNPVTTVPFVTAAAVDAGHRQAGGPVPGDGPFDSYEDGLRVLGLAASGVGLLSESAQVRVTPRQAPRPGAAAPVSLADLARDQQNLSDAADYPGHVRVVEVPQQAGGAAWVVEVSGTQGWDPRAGDNPFDLTSDLRLMAGSTSALTAGVARALALAQADAHAQGRVVGNEPVMLVGHSLGGIAASALAASPAFTRRHHVTHVVTMGSPVGRATVPPSVAVLSLEHDQDAVPRLEGQPNPDRRSWVTVTRDLSHDPTARTASAAHATSEYVETAALVDCTPDPSVAAWRDSGRPFFVADAVGSPVIRDYRIERGATEATP